MLGGNLQELARRPIRTGSGPTVYLRDIGMVENGTDIVTGYAQVNGRRTVYIPVTKRADASTLAVINRVKAALPAFQDSGAGGRGYPAGVRSVALRGERHSQPDQRRAAGRAADGPDGAAVPARLAQRR